MMCSTKRFKSSSKELKSKKKKNIKLNKLFKKKSKNLPR